MEAPAFSWPRVESSTGPVVPTEPSRDELALLQEEARKKGFAQGEAEGKQAYDAALKSAMAPVAELHQELNAYKLKLEEAELGMLANVMKQAFRSLLSFELRHNDEALVTYLQAGIDQLESPANLVIRVHPDWLERLAGTELESSLIADATLQDGQVAIDSDASRWHADPSAEFDTLIEATLGGGT